MKEKIEKYSKSIYMPFILLAVILICFHIPIEKSGDDKWFQNILNNQNIIDYSIERYQTWTARNVIETVLVSLTNTHVSTMIWKVLNICMFELIAYSIYKIFIKDIKDNNKKLVLTYILIFGILLIPKNLFNDAGWMATTTNYLWALALGIFTCTLIKKNLNNEKIKWYNTIFYVLATIYAANQELMAVVLFVIFTFYILYLIKNKKVKIELNKTTILVYIITILSLIYILTCPGNIVRKEKEIQTWYPEYQGFGIVSKMELGITSMMKYLIIDGRLVFILFTAVMAFYILKEHRNILTKIIGIIPFIGAVFCNVFSQPITYLFPKLMEVMGLYSKNELIINSTNLTDFSMYIPIAIYGVILLCIFINIFLIFRKSNTGIVAAIVYLLGLATRGVMGFSPTVFASAERPSLFLYFAFVIITLLIYKKMLDENKNISNITTLYIVFSLLNVLNSFSI